MKPCARGAGSRSAKKRVSGGCWLGQGELGQQATGCLARAHPEAGHAVAAGYETRGSIREGGGTGRSHRATERLAHHIEASFGPAENNADRLERA